jgi:hypothetical protein
MTRVSFFPIQEKLLIKISGYHSVGSEIAGYNIPLKKLFNIEYH